MTRPLTELPAPVRKGLGSPVLFGVVQAFIAAALYFSLGHVLARAHGWTWLVYLAAAGFFLVTMLAYVEGTSMHKERGGATILARYAFNELWSFVAGWAILLDYVILIALTALVATDYLSVFWGPLDSGAPELIVALILVLAVVWANVRGLDPARFERIALAGVLDLVVQAIVVVIGLALLFEPDVLTAPSGLGGDAGLADLAFGFTLAIVACTGLDASSGFAGQVAVGRRGLRRLVTARMIAVLVPYLGLTLLASGTLGAASTLAPEVRDSAVLGVLAVVEQEWLRDLLRWVVGASAALVLGTACTAAMLGLSRLGYALAVNRQIPSVLGRLHPRHATPVVVIGLATLLAIGLMLPVDVEFLAGIYAFGATIAFTLVHLSVVVMRFREPALDRPFVIPLNVRVGATRVPLPAVVGALVSVGSFGAVVWLHESARIAGVAWMAFGLVLYFVYRLSQGKSIFARVTVTESVLKREEVPGAQYGSILVPVLGTPLDDDVMQTAGRLAAEEGVDEEHERAQIEVMWVFEVPLSLPLDGPLPPSELKSGRAALAHAKAVGEEYEGVEVNTFTVRARSAGEAIVREARRRGVEAIVMPAEEPTRVRGGVLYGGKHGLRDTFVGDTTRYVVNKAACRVILTAPPGESSARTRPSARPEAPPLSGEPTRPVRRAAERVRQAAARRRPQ